MADEINSELEFKKLYRELPPEEKEMWLPKEIFFLSRSVAKLSSTQDDINTRVRVIENNCQKSTCDTETEPENIKNKVSKKVTYGGYGAGIIAVIYALIELLKVWRG